MYPCCHGHLRSCRFAARSIGIIRTLDPEPWTPNHGHPCAALAATSIDGEEPLPPQPRRSVPTMAMLQCWLMPMSELGSKPSSPTTTNATEMLPSADLCVSLATTWSCKPIGGNSARPWIDPLLAPLLWPPLAAPPPWPPSEPPPWPPSLPPAPLPPAPLPAPLASSEPWTPNLGPRTTASLQSRAESGKTPRAHRRSPGLLL